MRRRRPALPSGDLGQLAPAVRRTLLVRAMLVLAIAVALVTAALSAREPYVRMPTLFPKGTNGMLVLDVSASIGAQSQTAELLPELYPNPNRRIAAVLRAVAERNEPVGLVAFSDVAYELLPPASPARELAHLIRLFAPVPDADPFGVGSAFVENPWAESLTGGTLISAGLASALDAFRRDSVDRPSVLLVSDLDAPGDTALMEMLAGIRDAGMPLRIVSLAAAGEEPDAFARILGQDAFVSVEELESGRSLPLGAADVDRLLEPVLSRLMVLSAVVVLLLLAVHEGLLVLLPVPRGRKR